MALLSGLLAAVAIQTMARSADRPGPLATEDQRAVEAQAVKILASSAVQQQIAESTKLFAAHAAAASAEGKKTLPGAVNELALAAAIGAVNGDPARPKIVWAFAAPHTWLGHSMPGSRWGIDNPDNVYRFIPIDGVSTYELTVRPHQPGPVQYSFFLYDSFMGEHGKRDNLDKPIGGLRDRDIKTAADGSFTVTIDSAADAGRTNHIRSNADARYLMVRNTFSDWRGQTPLDVSIQRKSGPAVASAPAEAELATRTAELLKAGTDTVLSWVTKGFSGPKTVNVIAQPFSRGGGWGFAADGNFKLADDEALVFTLDAAGAQYVGVQLTDPWLVSIEHVRESGSLNINQVQKSQDGTYTYVVAARDPGVYNWLNTGGLHQGVILIRWQALPESTTSATGAVRSAKVVKLADLNTVLPSDARRVTVAERKKLLQERAQAYAHRYAATLPDTKVLASK
jgi:hypothetical protein